MYCKHKGETPLSQGSRCYFHISKAMLDFIPGSYTSSPLSFSSASLRGLLGAHGNNKNVSCGTMQLPPNRIFRNYWMKEEEQKNVAWNTEQNVLKKNICCFFCKPSLNQNMKFPTHSKTLTRWVFQPICKIWSSNWIISQFCSGATEKKSLELYGTPPNANNATPPNKKALGPY